MLRPCLFPLSATEYDQQYQEWPSICTTPRAYNPPLMIDLLGLDKMKTVCMIVPLGEVDLHTEDWCELEGWLTARLKFV